MTSRIKLHVKLNQLARVNVTIRAENKIIDPAKRRYLTLRFAAAK
jgi:hypothetical protein